MSHIKRFSEYLTGFEEGYVECLFWTDEDSIKEGMSDNGEDPDTLILSADRIDPVNLGEVQQVLLDFVHANWRDLQKYQETTGRTADFAGQDFALSRNGHGTGFWDRGAGELGDRLHAAAKVYGESSVYVGDDGTIYFT